MLVEATNKYEELKLKDKELGKIPKEGEKFEVSKKRYEVLTKTNKFNEVFVKEVEEETEIETATVKPKIETAVRKTKRKKK